MTNHRELRALINTQLLPRVEKPMRYQGDEFGSVHKEWDAVSLHLAFAFPDVYEIAMSHLGLSILYHSANADEDTLMERVFCPWPDMEAEMRDNDVPLFSLESQRPLREFDGIGFTLQYEMSYSNILTMLDLAGIPFYQKDRTDQDPLIFMGGPCAYNPEPLAPFVDFFVIGEGETLNLDCYQVIRAHQEKHGGKRKRTELLAELAKIEGVYVPAFYDVTYHEDGSIAQVTPNHPNVPAVVYKRVLAHMDDAFFPEKPIVPYLDVVHDRTMLEIQRGCTRGCRFCQAGMLYRPVREKTVEELHRQAKAILAFSGHDEVSLTSLSSSDYSRIMDLLHVMMDDFSEDRISVSLPSLRADHFSVGIAEEVQKVKRTGLTFAPEAGTQRLRDVINKNVTEDELEGVMEQIFLNGWIRVKLYFMIGLPTETEADLIGIVDLANKVLAIGDRIRRAKKEAGEDMPAVQVTISLSSFVPKPFTPFQFEPQDTGDTLRAKQRLIKERITNRRIKCNYHDSEVSYIEAVFAKGDRRLAPVLVRAHELGARFDGWSEYFDVDHWLDAFADVGLDPAFYAHRRIPVEEVMPWDHISCGVEKAYLVEEYEKALRAELTTDCRKDACTFCGVCQHYGIQPDIKEVRL